jgi:hypothetical protein
MSKNGSNRNAALEAMTTLTSRGCVCSHASNPLRVASDFRVGACFGLFAMPASRYFVIFATPGAKHKPSS